MVMGAVIEYIDALLHEPLFLAPVILSFTLAAYIEAVGLVRMVRRKALARQIHRSL